MSIRYSKMAINARLGDGTLGKGKNANITFMSTDKALLEFKAAKLAEEGYGELRWGTQVSGYGGKKTIYNVTTHVNEKATTVRDLPLETLITLVDREDLILWYIDDGSWHKSRNTMHLYSNMLTECQSQILIKRIGALYGVEPRLRIDRKKDGRQFYYLYFPRELVNRFRPDVKKYLTDANLTSLYYKFGGLDYTEKPPRYLTDKQVKEIRALAERGYNATDIYRIGLATYEQAKGIVSGRTYKHVI